MTDAAVRFLTLDHKPTIADQAARFEFQCPKGNGWCSGLLIANRSEFKRDPQNQNGGVAQWDFDGNADAPTFSPSIDCKGCWHGYIRAGRCVDTGGKDEP